MNAPWLQAAGQVSLYFYLSIVGGCLAALALRAAARFAGPSSVGIGAVPSPLRRSLRRTLIEYLGNTDPREAWHGPAAGLPDRRVNPQARFLMDFIQEEMARRDVAATEREELIQGLREAMRTSVGQDQHG